MADDVQAAIRIRVQHEDGRIETLTLRSPISVVVGDKLDRLVDADLEHFFTREGFYDGWGCGTNATPADAARLRKTIEAMREIDDE